jgi:GT2 family glycosyltransferase
MNLAVIILNWNGKKDTKECLESLLKQSDKAFTIYVVDNGSTDQSLLELKPLFPSVIWIENDKNEGFAKGNNIGIHQALLNGADAFFLLNNDTTLDQNCIATLKQAYQENPHAIIGCKVHNYFYPHLLDHIGGIFNSSTLNFDLIGLQKEAKEFQHSRNDLDYVSGCSMLIPKTIIDQIGYLDERFFLIWEEADFCFRAKKAGYLIRYCPDAKIYHKVSQSFHGKKHQSYFWWRNRFLFLLKHSEFVKASQAKKLLIKEIFKLHRHHLLKRLQLLFSKKNRKLDKKTKLENNIAALLGVYDFFLKRFGPPPLRVIKKR